MDGLKRFLTETSTNDILQVNTTLSTGALCKETFEELQRIGQQLEAFFHDMQNFEFVVDDILGKIFVLQCRPGKRTPKAAVTIAVEMVAEKVRA